MTRAILFLALVLGGCGGAAMVASAPQAMVEVERAEASAELSRGEEAPWNIGSLAETDVPAALVEAWQRAENREWCELVAFQGTSESTPQISEFDGGWAAEFQDGAESFGIMGSSIDPEMEDPEEAEERHYSDGSVLRYESGLSEEDPARVATIRIAGQGCVYQVWSLVDDAHLERIISRLRRVAGQRPGDGDGQALARE